MSVTDVAPGKSLMEEWYEKSSSSVNRIFIDMMSHDTAVSKKQFKSKEVFDGVLCNIAY